MAKRLIIHIGQPKTGTTSLQKTLVKSRDALATAGVCYPVVKGLNHSASVPFLSEGRNFPHHMLGSHNGDHAAVMRESRQRWDGTVAEFTRATAETIILSSEVFHDFGPVDAVPALIDKLRPYADRITAVAYVREPSALYLSLKQQNLKFGRIDAAPHTNRSFQVSLDPYLQALGGDFHVHAFSRDTLIGGDVVHDFAARYLPAKAQATLAPPQIDLNASISAELMAVCEMLVSDPGGTRWQFDNGIPGPFVAELLKIDRRVPGFRRAEYRPGIARVIHDLSTDLDWLNETLGIRFPPPEAVPDLLQIDPATLDNVRALCRVDEDRVRAILDALPHQGVVRLGHGVRQMRSTLIRTRLTLQSNLRKVL